MHNEHESEHRDPSQAVISVTPDRSAVASVDDVSGEIELARSQADDLVRGVRESTGRRQLAVLDEVTSVGVESQRNAGRQLELVKTRLATFLDEGGASKDVAARAGRPARRARPHQPGARAAQPLGSHGRRCSPSCVTTRWSDR